MSSAKISYLQSILNTLDGKVDGHCNSLVDQLICLEEGTEVEEKELMNKDQD